MSVKYTPDAQGMRALGQSSVVGNMVYQEALRLQREAQSNDPKGDYNTKRYTVTGGRNNEPRAGAMVSNPSNSGAKHQTLRRAAGNEIRRR